MVDTVKITGENGPEAGVADGDKAPLPATKQDNPMAGCLLAGDGIVNEERGDWHETRPVAGRDGLLSGLRRERHRYTRSEFAALHHYQAELAKLDVDKDEQGE